MDIVHTLLVSLFTFIASLGVSSTPAINDTNTTQNNNQTAQVSTQQPTQPATNATLSRNWSGYTARNGTFTGISGTWTVPQISGNNNYGIDAAWVGIGGVNSSDLIQAGTQGTVGRNGQVTYHAFFETLPEISRPLQISVNGGDSVTVSVTQQSPGLWEIAFKNNTNGQNTSITQRYDSSLSSADWIEEAPSSLRRIMPLDNFGTVQFTNATTVENGQTVNLAQANAQPISMGSYGQALAQASVLGNDGASFSVTRTTTPTTAINPAPQSTIYVYRRTNRRRFRSYNFY